MNFTELNAAVIDLRNSLRSFVGEKALSELTIRAPASDSDEASFLRLVNWSYVLLFEAGRVTIPYLLKLPSRTSSSRNDLQAALGLVQSLRTWCVHEIGFSSDRNKAMVRQVQTWFIDSCGKCPPDDDRAWQVSFEDVCFRVGLVVKHCQDAVELAVSSPDDVEDTIADLQRRLDRSWPAYRFDELVRDACTRFDLRLDVPKFREPRLQKWREVLETVPEEDDPNGRVVAIIERDILDFNSDILPFNGEDVMSALNLDPGPSVEDAMRYAREVFQSGIRDRDQLLERLRNDWPADKET